MKKLLLISFMIFWVSTTSVVTAALLRKSSADQEVAGVNLDASQNEGAVSDQSPSSSNDLTATDRQPNINTQNDTNKIARAKTSQGITSAQVALHNKPNDCWSTISGKVYNLTGLTSSHSGGSAVIMSGCGKDATALFNSHAHSDNAKKILNNYYVGLLASNVSAAALSSTNTPTTIIVAPSSVQNPAPIQPAVTQPIVVPTPTTVPTPAPPPPPTLTPTPPLTTQIIPPSLPPSEIAKHDTADDCWSNINNGVYNFTHLISIDSGWAAAITSSCGQNGTNLFNAYSYAGDKNSILKSYYVGNFAPNNSL